MTAEFLNNRVQESRSKVNQAIADYLADFNKFKEAFYKGGNPQFLEVPSVEAIERALDRLKEDSVLYRQEMAEE